MGRPAPGFAMECIDEPQSPSRQVQLADYRGRWLVLFFYPRDFSVVCPTELAGFSGRAAEFRSRQCDLLAASVDVVEAHREWLSTPPALGGIGPLQFPLASDDRGETARAYGSWSEEEQVATRGLFIIDPDGLLQYSVVHNLNIGRNVDEVLRVLDALQTGGFCPANWISADGVLDPEKALQPGRVIGHYRIRGPLGAGAFGSVFAARDLRLERPVALKVLRRSLEESRAALLSEAQSAAALNHPNICTIYSVEEEGGLPLIAMEYIEGQALDQRIARGLQEGDVRTIFYGICLGLAAAHARGIVHGDLKPANIIVNLAGEPKILDFGLARRRREQVHDTRTLLAQSAVHPQKIIGVSGLPSDSEQTIAVSRGFADGLAGTPAYMAPEQAMGQATVPASDVFSLGTVLYEMLTGRSAMSGLQPIEAIMRLHRSDLSETLPRDVGEPWRGMLTAMLQREPAERPLVADIAARAAELL